VLQFTRVALLLPAIQDAREAARPSGKSSKNLLYFSLKSMRMGTLGRRVVPWPKCGLILREDWVASDPGRTRVVGALFL
jgi:hypothetical protein